MNLIKRNIIAFIFTCLTSAPLFIELYFYISKILIEHEMESALEKSNLQEVRVATSRIIWLKSGKEILIDGYPFDVKQSRQEGSVTVFTGLFDKKEKKLNARLVAFEKDQEASSNQDNFHAVFLCFFFHAGEKFYTDHHHFFIKKTYGLYPHNKINNLSLSLAPPPPKQVSHIKSV